MVEFDYVKVQEKWQKKWSDAGVFKANLDKSRPKYYCLEMFPYPSGSGLHMGHAFNYTIGDVYSRFKRMNGFNVLYPMGYDSFGLPAENAAIKANSHPKIFTEDAIQNFIRQQKALGLSYDWDRILMTHSPEYYKWNQFIFLKFLENGLAYRKKAAVNWCPKCDTVLANEQVQGGKCWRHPDTEIHLKQLEQWFIKTTKYAEELLTDLNNIDWPKRIKVMQENWIGKSFGTEIDFEIDEKSDFVLLHGYTGAPENNFFPWLKKELENKGKKARVPRLPKTDNPVVLDQVDYVLKNEKFDENTVLLGHSLGCAVALKVLENLNVKIKKLVLVGGFIDTDFKDKKHRPFEKSFNWKFDFERIKNNVKEIVILRDSSDYAISHEQIDRIKEKLGVGEIIDATAKKPHFTNETEPIILDSCLNSWPVFTTRPDTIFGVTFMVVSAQHPKLMTLVTEEQKSEIDELLKKIKSTSEKDVEELEKEGAFTGSYAINPLTKEKVPIYAGNFVVAEYGSGMVMAVPAHDQRDFEFAKKYGIPIKQVVSLVFKLSEGKDKVRDDKKTVKRKTIIAIIKHWEKNEYFCLDWEKYGWKSFIIGGVEEGESPIDAVNREVMEETGYQNFNIIKKVSGEVHSHYFAAHKDENRYAETECFYVELKDEAQTKVEDEHKKNHKGLWVKKNDVFKFVNLNIHTLYWRHFNEGDKSYTEGGVLINSGEFSGLNNEIAKDKITEFLESTGLGKKTVQYKLRDWLVSRQRYWGTPIPVVYCDKCGIVPAKESDLPIKLPEDITFGQGNPILSSKSFVNTKCPRCNSDAKRETDTMDTFFDSSWYYIRYADNKNDKEMFDKSKVDYWLPVDQYIGGAEHACMHLVYARFFTKALRDIGYLSFDEPFLKLFNQGMLHGPDGFVMSKSRGNVVTPETISEKYGIDTARFFLLSIASPDKDLEWSDKGIEGAHRFVKNVITYFETVKTGESSKLSLSKLNRTIKEVTEDIEDFRYNLAIIKLRMLFESLKEEESTDTLEKFLILLHPICPHITEELYENLGKKGFLTKAKWPKADESLIDEKEEFIEQMEITAKSDIATVLSLAKIDLPKRITIIISQEWKYSLFKRMKEKMDETRDLREIMMHVLLDEELKKHAQNIQKIVPNILKDPKKIPPVIIDQRSEKHALEGIKKMLAEVFKAEIEIVTAEESTHSKAHGAMPSKPAIVVE